MFDFFKKVNPRIFPTYYPDSTNNIICAKKVLKPHFKYLIIELYIGILNDHEVPILKRNFIAIEILKISHNLEQEDCLLETDLKNKLSYESRSNRGSLFSVLNANRIDDPFNLYEATVFANSHS
jgi:hypothetical protein